MKNLKEFEVKNLNQITAGVANDVIIKFSGFFDKIKGNEDVRIGIEHTTTGQD